MAEKLKKANPSITVLAQVSTLRGSVQTMNDAFSAVKNNVDGVTMFYGLTEGNFTMLTEFLDYVKDGRTEPILKPSVPNVNESSPEIKIPDWLRNNAGWWADGLIGDSDFVSGIQFLIKEKIIRVPETERREGTESIPDWVRNNAKLWSHGLITDKDFVSGLQYLSYKLES